MPLQLRPELSACAEIIAEEDAGLLLKLKLTEGAYLKRAAVLLFHPEPQAYVAGAFVKIGFPLPLRPNQP